MQILGELFFANQGRKMGVMPSASGTILWTQSGAKRGSIESSFILSTVTALDFGYALTYVL